MSGFTITVQQNTHIGIDWNVRQGLTDPVGQDGYHLTPAHRVVDMTEHGSISGTVADGLVMGDCDPLVYVYEEFDVVPDDMGSGTEPLTTAMVEQDLQNASAWSYSVPFLDPMNYTVAFTCDAIADEPCTDEAITFQQPQNTTVTDGGDSPISF